MAARSLANLVMAMVVRVEVGEAMELKPLPEMARGTGRPAGGGMEAVELVVDSMGRPIRWRRMLNDHRMLRLDGFHNP